MKAIKIAYHTFATVLLLWLALSFFLQKSCLDRKKKRWNRCVAVCLFLMAIFHAYDVWWFCEKDGPAPI
jgi:protein-S-isoprenylcysteine O-methyltransferase Ste14